MNGGLLSGWKKVIALGIVVILVVAVIGAVLLTGSTSASAMKTIWLDQEEEHGFDQVTELADGGDAVYASAKGLGDGGEELFTVRAYDSSGVDKWTTHLDLGKGKNVASAVAASESTIAAAGVGTTLDGDKVIMVAALSASDGEVRWNATYDGGAGVNYACDVKCYGDAVYVAGTARDQDGGDQFLVLAFGSSNGELLWMIEISGGGGENAALCLEACGEGVFAAGFVEDVVGKKEMLVISLDPQVGSELWRDTFDAGQGDNRATEIAVAGGAVVVSGMGKVENRFVPVLREHKATDGSLVWSTVDEAEGAPDDIRITGSDVFVVGVLEDSYFLRCIELSSGRMKWCNAEEMLGAFNFKAAVDARGGVVTASFFGQHITEDAEYAWQIAIGQFAVSDGRRLSGEEENGTGKTTIEVDVLIHGDKVFYTTSLEKSAPLLLSSGPAIAVDGRNITVNGERLIFKGVNYSPAPIGSDNQWCPWGDWFQEYWSSIYERDVPKLAAMGANVVKVYGMTAFPWDNPKAPLISHTGFYDLLHENGIHVMPSVFTTGELVGSYSSGKWSTDPTLQQWAAIIAEAKDHPAVLGWTVGNELNRDTNLHDASFWSKYNELIGAIKTKAPGKLTMVGLQDQAESGGGIAPIRLHDASMTNLDIWGVNSYRGLINSGFDTLFSTHKANSQKPLLVTEFGPPASTRDGGSAVLLPDNALAAAEYLKAHWTGHADSIMNNTDVCSGGFVFEWTDEWYKRMNPTQHDPSSAGNDAFPGKWWDEEWFGLNGGTVNGRNAANPDPGRPDTLVPRAAVATLTQLWAA